MLTTFVMNQKRVLEDESSHHDVLNYYESIGESIQKKGSYVSLKLKTEDINVLIGKSQTNSFSAESPPRDSEVVKLTRKIILNELSEV
jgi:hypothetical protein